jgi:tRNA G18 (ribose-2'-O)-methylase SpoU
MTNLRLTEVNSADDMRLGAFRDLHRYDGHADGFVAEGSVVLDTVLSEEHCPIDSVFVARERVGRNAHLLSRLSQEVPLYVAPLSVMQDVTGVPLKHGLLAWGTRRPLPELGELLDRELGKSTTFLVLEGLIHPENVGVCFRNAAALGVSGVILDEDACDPLVRRSIRISVGHVLSVPWARAPISKILAALEERKVCRAALTTEQHAEPVECSRRPAGRLALILGSEQTGVSRSVLQCCELNLRIPTAAGVGSLNVAVAGAIGLFALRDPRAFATRAVSFGRRKTFVESDASERINGAFDRVPTKLEGIPD